MKLQRKKTLSSKKKTKSRNETSSPKTGKGIWEQISMSGSDESSRGNKFYYPTSKEMEKAIDKAMKDMFKNPNGFGSAKTPNFYATKDYHDKNTGNSKKIYRRLTPWEKEEIEHLE